LDWRHPHTHSLYWSQLGVEQYHDLRDKDKVDLLNTKRQSIHSLQGLSHFGTIAFNPLAPAGHQLDLLPDPDMIDGYLACIQEAKDSATDEEYFRIRAEAFANGEENFLQFAVLNTYLYGTDAKAQHYYNILQTQFKDSDTNTRHGWYDMAIGDFVAMLILDDDLGRTGMISLINSKLTLAFRSGLAKRRPQVFTRNLELAQNVHKAYNEKYAHETGLDVGGGRMRLPEFPRMVEDTYTQFMQNRTVPLFYRVNAYQYAHQLAADGFPLAPNTYNRWIKPVRDELLQQGQEEAQIPTILPPPANAVEGSEDMDQEQGGKTIERK